MKRALCRSHSGCVSGCEVTAICVASQQRRSACVCAGGLKRGGGRGVELGAQEFVFTDEEIEMVVKHGC